MRIHKCNFIFVGFDRVSSDSHAIDFCSYYLLECIRYMIIKFNICVIHIVYDGPSLMVHQLYYKKMVCAQKTRSLLDEFFIR